jgi:N-methylhydantoinase A
VPLFNRAAFGAGDRFAGPAIISQLDATTLVLPNWMGEVHPSGAILLTMLKTRP